MNCGEIHSKEREVCARAEDSGRLGSITHAKVGWSSKQWNIAINPRLISVK
jgi:hypothetical protein